MVTYDEKEHELGETPDSKGQRLAKRNSLILSYWNSNLTLFKIAAICKCREPNVKKVFTDKFGTEEVKLRSKKLYSTSKLGSKNSMKGKTGELHHGFIGYSYDNKGYRTVLKPAWWTSNSKSKRIFEHHYVAALKYGLTEIPAKWSVHHCDGDKLNNDPINLLLITSSAHTKLHAVLKRVTTSRKT